MHLYNRVQAFSSYPLVSQGLISPTFLVEGDVATVFGLSSLIHLKPDSIPYLGPCYTLGIQQS